MAKTTLAAQLYTLREFTKTPKDIATTLRRVKSMGYDAVQLSALGPIDPQELKRILDGEGLRVCATHVPYDRMRNETQAVIDEHQLWGCTFTAVGGMPTEYRNEEGYYRFAKEASEVARRLAASGIDFGYHNHSFEFERFSGRTGLEILAQESDPEVFKMEIDTYWVQHGGGDPAAWIANLKGRVPVIHVKDMVIKEGKQLYAEVGEGNLNWDAILKAGGEAGVEWYVVEQDVCQRDPFESLEISLRNLRKMGLK